MLALTDQWDELQDAWLEALDGKISPDEASETVGVLMKRGEGGKARILAQTAVAPFERRGLHEKAVEMARVVASVRGVEDQEIPEIVISAFRAIHSGRPEADGLLRKALVYRGKGLKALLDTIDAMFLFAQGDIVHHKGGWGYGRIVRISGRTEQLSVEFEGGRVNEFQLLSAGELLRKISPGSFEGLKFRDPASLKAMAASNPLALVRLLLESRGGKMPVKSLKDEISPDIVPREDLNSWWAGVRGALKRDPYIELDQGSGPWIRFLEKPVSFGETRLKEVDFIPSLRDGVRKVRAYLSESRAMIEHEVLAKMLARLRDLARENPDAPPGDLAGLWFLARRAEERGFGTIELPFALADVVRDADSFAAAMESSAVLADQGKLLDFALETRPEEWPAWFESVFYLAESSVLDRAARTLIERGHAARVESAFAALAQWPRKHPLAFLWMFRSVLAGRFRDIRAPSDVVDMTEKALLLTNKQKMRDEFPPETDAGKVYNKAREILTEQHFRNLFDEIGALGTKRLIDFIDASGLRRNFTETIEQIGISKHPGIVTRSPMDERPDSEFIFVTAEGLSRKRAEYERLINVDVEANRIALGKAIAMGDLSENAELDAARELQRQLSRKANDMEAALVKAREIDFSKIGREKVEIGSAIEAADEDGTLHRFLILGPWDVEPEQGIISYTAPLGAAFLGGSPGDSVSVKLPDGEKTYRIGRILGAEEFRRTDEGTPPEKKA